MKTPTSGKSIHIPYELISEVTKLIAQYRINKIQEQFLNDNKKAA